MRSGSGRPILIEPGQQAFFGLSFRQLRGLPAALLNFFDQTFRRLGWPHDPGFPLPSDLGLQPGMKRSFHGN